MHIGPGLSQMGRRSLAPGWSAPVERERHSWYRQEMPARQSARCSRAWRWSTLHSGRFPSGC